MPDLLERLKSALADRYGIEKEIGRGGMAVVFLAEDLKHHRQVALKVLHPELTATLGAERFLQEIEIAAGLQHPHILPLYDSGEADGLLYYVMPYAEGESLRHRLDREAQLAVDESVRIAVEVADGLNYAHRKGVVHRDIKPGNILLAEGHATVADFGIARAVEAARQQKITRTGLGVGTPLYASPEQATAQETLDGRTDIYSLGCVLYEMLAGEPPLTGATPQMIQARRLSETPTALHALRDTVPPALDSVIARALARIPADRYATASQFGQALQAVLFASTPGSIGDSSTTPQSVTTPHSGRVTKERTSLRNWLPVAAVAGALAVAGTWMLFQSQTRQGLDDPPPQGPSLDSSRVAVLAFDYADESESLLASSLTESVSQELGAVDGFRVVPTDSVRQLEDLGLSRESLQRVLDAGFLVEGLVLDRRRLVVSLIGADEGTEQYTRHLRAADAVALRDSATRTLRAWLARASGLSRELLQQAVATTERATALMDAGDVDAANDLLGMADMLLKAAEDNEPEWVEPPVRRGWLAYQRSRWAGSVDQMQAGRWIDEGMNHATVANQLQPEHPDALELRGTLRYWKWLLDLEPDPETAEQLFADAEADLRLAISVNPDQSGAWAILSHMLLNREDLAAANEAVRQALTADPTVKLINEDVLLWRAFTASYDLGELDEAEYWCGIIALMYPDGRAAECRLWQMTLPGAPTDADRAWALADEAVELQSSQEMDFYRRWAGMAVAAVLARGGVADSARAVAYRSRGDASVDPTRDLMYVEAFVRTLLGDNEDALDLLTEFMVVSGGEPSDIDYWWFDGLREEPRYQALLGTGVDEQ